MLRYFGLLAPRPRPLQRIAAGHEHDQSQHCLIAAAEDCIPFWSSRRTSFGRPVEQFPSRCSTDSPFDQLWGCWQDRKFSQSDRRCDRIEFSSFQHDEALKRSTCCCCSPDWRAEESLGPKYQNPLGIGLAAFGSHCTQEWTLLSAWSQRGPTQGVLLLLAWVPLEHAPAERELQRPREERIQR